jgi:purine-binding chemotaxis protein CheW
MSRYYYQKKAQTSSQMQYEKLQYLTFSLETEKYAIPIKLTREIIEYRELVRIPLMPKFLKGVINLRGTLVPVLDLFERLNGAPLKISKRTVIIMIEMSFSDEHALVGLIVDEVSEVLSIAPDQIFGTPELGSKIPMEFIDRFIKLVDSAMIVLKVQNLFSLNELKDLKHLNDKLITDSEKKPDSTKGEIE